MVPGNSGVKMTDIFDILESYLSQVEITQVRFFHSWSDIPVGTEVGFVEAQSDRWAVYFKWNGKRFVRMKCGVPHLDDIEDDCLSVHRGGLPFHLDSDWIVRKPYE